MLNIIEIARNQFCSITPLIENENILDEDSELMIKITTEKNKEIKQISILGWIMFNNLKPRNHSIMRFYNIMGEDEKLDVANMNEIFHISYDNKQKNKSAVVLRLNENDGWSERRYQANLSTDEWYFVAYSADYSRNKISFFISNLDTIEIERKFTVLYSGFNITQRSMLNIGCGFEDNNIEQNNNCLNGVVKNYHLIFEHFDNLRYLFLLIAKEAETTIFVLDLYDKTLDLGHAKNSSDKTYKIIDKRLVDEHEMSINSNIEVNNDSTSLTGNSANIKILNKSELINHNDISDDISLGEQEIIDRINVLDTNEDKHESSLSKRKVLDESTNESDRSKNTVKHGESNSEISKQINYEEQGHKNDSSIDDKDNTNSTGNSNNNNLENMVNESHVDINTSSNEDNSFENVQLNNDNRKNPTNKDGKNVKENSPAFEPVMNNDYNEDMSQNNQYLGETDNFNKGSSINSDRIVNLEESNIDGNRGHNIPNYENIMSNTGRSVISNTQMSDQRIDKPLHHSSSSAGTFSRNIDQNNNIINSGGYETFSNSENNQNNRSNIRQSNSNLRSNDIKDSNLPRNNPASQLSYSSFGILSNGIANRNNLNNNLNELNNQHSRLLTATNNPNSSPSKSQNRLKNPKDYKPFNKYFFNNQKYIIIKEAFVLKSSMFMNTPTIYINFRYKGILGDSYRLLQLQSNEKELLMSVDLVKSNKNYNMNVNIPSLDLTMNNKYIIPEDQPKDFTVSIIQFQKRIAILFYYENTYKVTTFVETDINDTYDLLIFDQSFKEAGMLELYNLQLLTSPSAFIYKVDKSLNDNELCDKHCDTRFVKSKLPASCIKCNSDYTLFPKDLKCHLYCPIGYRNIEGVCFQCNTKNCAELSDIYFEPKWLGDSNIMIQQIINITNFHGNYTDLFNIKMPALSNFNYTTRNFPSNNSAIYHFNFPSEYNYYNSEVKFTLNPNIVLYDRNKNRLQDQGFSIRFGSVDGNVAYRNKSVENRLRVLAIVAYAFFVLTMIVGTIGSLWKCLQNGYHQFLYQKTIQSFIMFQYFAFWSFYNSNIPYNAKNFLNGLFVYSTGWHDIFTRAARNNNRDNQKFLNVIDNRVLPRFTDLGVSNTFMLSAGFILLIQGIAYFIYIILRFMHRKPVDNTACKDIVHRNLTSRILIYVINEYEFKGLVTFFTLFMIEITVFALYNLYDPNTTHALFIVSFIWASIWLLILLIIISYISIYSKRSSILLKEAKTAQKHGFIYDGITLKKYKKYFQSVQYIHYTLFSVILIVAYKYRTAQVLVNLLSLIGFIVFVFVTKPASTRFDNYEQLGVHLLVLVAKIFMVILVFDENLGATGEFGRWIVGYFVAIIIFIIIIWNCAVVCYKLAIHVYTCSRHNKSGGLYPYSDSKDREVKKADTASINSGENLGITRERSRIQNIERLKDLLSATNTIEHNSKKREDQNDLAHSSEIKNSKSNWTSKFQRNKTTSLMQAVSKDETDQSDNNNTILYIDYNKDNSQFKHSYKNASQNDKEITFQARSQDFYGNEPNEDVNTPIVYDLNNSIIRSGRGYGKMKNLEPVVEKQYMPQKSTYSNNSSHNAIKVSKRKEEFMNNIPSEFSIINKNYSLPKNRNRSESFETNPSKLRRISAGFNDNIPKEKLKRFINTINNNVKNMDTIESCNIKKNIVEDDTSNRDNNLPQKNYTKNNKLRIKLQQHKVNGYSNYDNEKRINDNDTIVDINDEVVKFLEKNFTYKSQF